MPLACFDANSNKSTHWKHAKGMSLRYGAIFVIAYCGRCQLYWGGEKMATNSGGEFVALLYIVCNGCAIWR